ncbi:hypothetical protein PILCRDRAFT_810340 [Piloderma croceum F 1598]|uniref:Uncharacterized protein n=1 Tax=Piloderma croceum (strain F 1598) TaxID=765440 RepID=A0A0C3GP06_PILCF|nr:hypothetical protein PILCRDRAFT_810340 [Piloderma croceum F 1598]
MGNGAIRTILGSIESGEQTLSDESRMKSLRAVDPKISIDQCDPPQHIISTP